MRFVDGLCEDIKSMVMIQCPSTYDIACALALVQEEAVDSGWRKEFRRFEPISHKMAPKQALPLPLSPKPDKGLGLSPADDKYAPETARVGSSDDKIQALKQYHRARGLCDRCAKKWVYGRKCSSTVQLHVVQELMELLSEDSSSVPDSVPQYDELDHQLCLVYLNLPCLVLSPLCL
jgi:hypothetical protein